MATTMTEMDTDTRRQRQSQDGELDSPVANGDGSHHGANHNAQSAKKRRRGAKANSDKKFECKQEGCGKSYSRAEHLYRHQLNRK